MPPRCGGAGIGLFLSGRERAFGIEHAGVPVLHGLAAKHDGPGAALGGGAFVCDGMADVAEVFQDGVGIELRGGDEALHGANPRATPGADGFADLGAVGLIRIKIKQVGFAPAQLHLMAVGIARLGDENDGIGLDRLIVQDKRKLVIDASLAGEALGDEGGNLVIRHAGQARLAEGPDLAWRHAARAAVAGKRRGGTPAYHLDKATDNEGFEAWLYSNVPGLVPMRAYERINLALNLGLTPESDPATVEELRASEALKGRALKPTGCASTA